jgi:hypothetical protein
MKQVQLAQVCTYVHCMALPYAHSLPSSFRPQSCTFSSLPFSDAMHRNIVGELMNCDGVTNSMSELLEKMSSGSLGRRMQWTAFEEGWDGEAEVEFGGS